MRAKDRIGVLMGGPSAERDVSLRSGAAVYDSLRSMQLNAVVIDIESDDSRKNRRLIKGSDIDCAFLTLHGRYGEDGQIQTLLDDLHLPYTHSGPHASRLAMDKVASRRLMQIYGVPVPAYKVFEKQFYKPCPHFYYGIPFPLIVKPVFQGSSIGLTLVHHPDQFERAVQKAFECDNTILVEQFISGREMTVGILGNRALPVIEIVPKSGFFDFQSKYSMGMTEYRVPAAIDDVCALRIQSTALLVHSILGCHGCSRIDLILDVHGVPYVLELNAIPGFTPTSLLPKAARCAGIEFAELCSRLIELAYEKA